MVPSLCGLPPHLITSKSPQPICSSKSYKYGDYDKTKYKIQIQSFSLLLDPPGKSDYQAIHCPTANFRSLLRGSITNHLITVFDTCLAPKVTGNLSLSQDSSDSECSALTHFSMSLAHGCVNLKEPSKNRSLL